MHDSHDQLVPTGIYMWEVRLSTPSHVETKTVKTAVITDNRCDDPD